MALAGTVSPRGCVSLEEVAGLGGAPTLLGRRQGAWEGQPEASFQSAAETRLVCGPASWESSAWESPLFSRAFNNPRGSAENSVV